MILEMSMFKRKQRQDPMQGRCRLIVNKCSGHIMVGLEGLNPQPKRYERSALTN